MTPPLFIIDNLDAESGLVQLTGPEGKHAVAVTRMRVGEELSITNGRGLWLDCVVTELDGKSGLTATIQETTVTAPITPIITVVQALPKSERSELAIELATEAGADAFIPWEASRCVARWAAGKGDKGKTEKGIAKWKAATRAASKQSRRALIPDIGDLVVTATVAELIRAEIARGGVAAVLHESATKGIATIQWQSAATALIIIGPEGGISEDELALFVASGAESIRLGPHVLRTSTAAAVAISAIGALTNRWV